MPEISSDVMFTVYLSANCPAKIHPMILPTMNTAATVEASPDFEHTMSHFKKNCIDISFVFPYDNQIIH